MLDSTASINAEVLSSSQRTARTLVLRIASALDKGSLSLIENFSCSESREMVSERFGSESGTHAAIEIKNPQFYPVLLKGGSIAVGEAFMNGWWDSPDLTALMRLMAENLPVLDRLESKAGKLSKLLYKFDHWLNKNSKANSRRNIEAHYDIGNDLYKLFLDSNMLYSSGIYLSEQESLEVAQKNKMERLCLQLQLKSSDHVLEIGTGWGAMAIYMAENYGCKVTTTTISEQQYQYAKQEIEQRGLSQQITLLKKDYRELTGRFDKLVSIEMIEAVGKQYLPSYVKKCNELLKPDGLMAIQAITIADQRYHAYSSRVDFIQKYIFPGGFLPSVTALLETTTRHSRLVATNVKDIGQDYASTLSEWHTRFTGSVHQVRQLGYDERFIRMWRYYLSYCEGGFLAKSISTVQLTLRKAG
ncbi:cyclopropane-fatty-acyl-phospholipid synthase family protein [Vibrio sp. JC009]|uniref:SAM-dependent methyltransferase n=1 Tax=Vibrio sp. JC009 TaxID=2912314 RepID=UPI0023B030D3|nr:cyclopropane-fatty-acyl-phospholipid synthase family protein [Vibrio sp. JC009]WED22727.1 cyclopropane-fatty-acyl-phospholipid synthase family protein [Vibrio sp. JC009]